MNVIETEIPDVLILEPRKFQDERGYFLEAWHRDKFAEIGIAETFVQENLSHSVQGVLRGLHYQIEHAQGKLVKVIDGSVVDIAVDLRRSSKTYGHHVSVKLESANHRMLWIPPGFAHGFYVLSKTADVSYKCTEFFAPEFERNLAWNDPDLGIRWPLINGKPPLVAIKDSLGAPLRTCDTYP
jgi:dTDP-4-dehydrorhamnose 3,5-epimerase